MKKMQKREFWPSPIGILEVLCKLFELGRHPCNCQARIHQLVRNCLICGRIVCEQEGSGPCFHCGNLVCTRKEREVGTTGTIHANFICHVLRLFNVSINTFALDY